MSSVIHRMALVPPVFRSEFGCQAVYDRVNAGLQAHRLTTGPVCRNSLGEWWIRVTGPTHVAAMGEGVCDFRDGAGGVLCVLSGGKELTFGMGDLQSAT